MHDEGISLHKNAYMYIHNEAITDRLSGLSNKRLCDSKLLPATSCGCCVTGEVSEQKRERDGVRETGETRGM